MKTPEQLEGMSQRQRDDYCEVCWRRGFSNCNLCAIDGMNRLHYRVIAEIQSDATVVMDDGSVMNNDAEVDIDIDSEGVYLTVGRHRIYLHEGMTIRVKGKPIPAQPEAAKGGGETKGVGE